MIPEALQWLSVLSNLATSLGVVFGVVGLVLVWLQMRQNTLSREASICLTLAQFSSTHEFQQSLRAIKGLATSEDLTEADQEAALRVCVFLELVGSICNHGYMSTKLIEQFYGSLITSCYATLSDYIADRREHTANPKFAANFEMLATRLRNRDA